MNYLPGQAKLAAEYLRMIKKILNKSAITLDINPLILDKDAAILRLKVVSDKLIEKDKESAPDSIEIVMTYNMDDNIETSEFDEKILLSENIQTDLQNSVGLGVPVTNMDDTTFSDLPTNDDILETNLEEIQ